MKRSFLNLKGSAAIVKGAEEFSAHHYTFPDAKLLKTLVSSQLYTAPGFNLLASR